jgi:hypothetical protein
MMGLLGRRKKTTDTDLASAVTAVNRLEVLTDRLEDTTALLDALVHALKVEEEVTIEEVRHGDA